VAVAGLTAEETAVTQSAIPPVHYRDLDGNCFLDDGFFFSTKSGDEVSCLKGTNIGWEREGFGGDIGAWRRACGIITLDKLYGEAHAGAGEACESGDGDNVRW